MKRFAYLIFVVLLAACATTPPQPTPLPPFGAQVSALKSRILELVEAERQRSNGEAKPLMLDPELMNAAQLHSEEMAMKGSFDTDNPNGNVAVNILLGDPKFRGVVGENSAAQYFTPGTRIDTDVFARGFLNIWLKSDDHRMNLVYPRFEKTGIGIAVAGNTIYAAELFASDLGLPEPP